MEWSAQRKQIWLRHLHILGINTKLPTTSSQIHFWKLFRWLPSMFTCVFAFWWLFAVGWSHKFKIALYLITRTSKCSPQIVFSAKRSTLQFQQQFHTLVIQYGNEELFLSIFLYRLNDCDRIQINTLPYHKMTDGILWKRWSNSRLWLNENWKKFYSWRTKMLF